MQVSFEAGIKLLNLFPLEGSSNQPLSASFAAKDLCISRLKSAHR
jgi:hypothetical protein